MQVMAILPGSIGECYDTAYLDICGVPIMEPTRGVISLEALMARVDES